MAPAAQYFWVLLQERFCSISLRPVGKTEKLSARLCRSGWPLPQSLFPCMLPCSALHILPRHTGSALWQRSVLLMTRNMESFLPALRQLLHFGHGENDGKGDDVLFLAFCSRCIGDFVTKVIVMKGRRKR